MPWLFGYLPLTREGVSVGRRKRTREVKLRNGPFVFETPERKAGTCQTCGVRGARRPARDPRS